MRPFPPDLLGLPPAEGALAVLRVLRRRALDARRRVEAHEDPEGLHDFRVALRRLRSCLRAYRPLLRGALPDRLRRQLGDIAAATGGGRDAEVQLQWIQSVTPTLTPVESPGVEFYAAQLTDRLAAYRGAARDHVQRFDRFQRSLRGRLRAAGQELHGDAGGLGPKTLAAATGALALEQTAELGARLAEVAWVGNEEEAHRARISAKRLRYLLEPVAVFRPDADAVVLRLRNLQDLLGDLHDMHVTAAAIALVRMDLEGGRGAAAARKRARSRARDHKEPGLAALLRKATARQRDLFATLEREWLGSALEEFLARAEEVGKGLVAGGGVPLEIERKYLLTGLPAMLRGANSLEVHQGWLPGTVLRERIRRLTDGGRERYYRTVKLGTGVERIEIEEETTPELFSQLWPLTEGRRVLKRRYQRRDHGLVWEVDVFDGRELVLAEVELPSAATAVEPPRWLRDSVVREVTGEAAYSNVNLAH